jgi:hypothetical protein
MKRIVTSALAVLSFWIISTALPAADLPYTEGSVFEMTYVRVLPGGWDAYLNFLQTDWKKVNEAAKKEGLILGYHVGASPAANKDDWDLVLVVEYKNMAALDGLEEKLRGVSESVAGPSQKQEQRSMERGKVREIVGTKLVRELLLK